MKTAFLFSGQGAQYPGMGKELYDSFDVAKEVFDTGTDVLGRSLTDLCFEGNQDELNLTHNTQVCMLAVDLAAGYALKSLGIKADCVAGFSLGEYAALVFAGVMDIRDAFRIVQIRADAMQAAVSVGKGAMAALMGADGVEADKICSMTKEGYVAPANYNSPVQTVISGDDIGVNAAIKLAEEQGYTAIKLSVSAPFHCKLMDPAAIRVGDELKKIDLKDPFIPVYMNVTGKAILSADKIPDLLVRQAMGPVQWVNTLENMKLSDIENYIECGAGKTLWGLTRKTLKNVNSLKAVDLKSLNDTIQKLNG